MRRYRIGRADTNDIVLADSTVSREHAELSELGGGRFRIKDLGSTYGVAIWQGQDWEKVTETELRHDTQLRIGEYQTTVADLLSETDKTVVRARAGEPPAPAPSEALDAENTVPPVTPRTPAPARTAPPEPPRPAPPRPAPPKAPRSAEPSQSATTPPQPAGPAFQFLRNLPPEKRTLVWLGVGFAGFLLISLITLILALVL
jgi:predicted component of type VI protein secretion system